LIPHNGFLLSKFYLTFIKHRSIAMCPAATSYKIYPDKFYTTEYIIDLKSRTWEFWRKDRGLNKEQFDELWILGKEAGIGIEMLWKMYYER
ncbi:MAG: hypothetical protein NG712_06055, partial [Omnitrophica bacterium]|nr:hypothetical protein [Candidatus Omnitrophota bacterium]